MPVNKPKIVIFGAGNIGRSFIAPVFSRGGYEVVFADVAAPVLRALRVPACYDLVEKSDSGDRHIKVGPVRAVNAADAVTVAAELGRANLCATCVGASALPAVIRTIGSSVSGRQRPLDIILAENLKGAAQLTRSLLEDSGLTSSEMGRIGIVETSIGKMVPLMPKKTAQTDPLLCWAEPFNTLIADRDGFTGPVPDIPDFMPVSPIAPWVARKLYIHNFGHAAAAYIGHSRLPKSRYIYEVLEDPQTASEVRSAMAVCGEALRLEFPGVFSADEIDEHICDLIQRFKNRALGDTVYRVGRDLRRKLQRRDRVVGAVALALKHGLETAGLLNVFRAALEFRAPGPSGMPDAEDLQVIETAANPKTFLREIVQTDGEPELENLLLNALKNS